MSHVDDHVEVCIRGVGRPSKTAPYREDVKKILSGEPGLMSLEILRRVRERGYEGGKSAMYRLIAELRPRDVDVQMRFEGLPGEFSQHDFGEVNVRFIDGTVRKIRFFASRLKCNTSPWCTLRAGWGGCRLGGCEMSFALWGSSWRGRSRECDGGGIAGGVRRSSGAVRRDMPGCVTRRGLPGRRWRGS